MTGRRATRRWPTCRAACSCRSKSSPWCRSVDMAEIASNDDPVKRLNRLDCCAVSDAMDKLGLKGSVSGLEQRAGTRRIAGRIVTYKLVPAADAPKATGAPRHLGTTAIEAAQPGEII